MSADGYQRRSSRNLQIISLAQAGNPPAEIALQTKIPVDTIYGVLSEARLSGISIPDFAGRNGRNNRPIDRDAPRHRPPTAPPAAPPARAWLPDDDARLADLLGRGVRLTAVAAAMRQPYAAIIAAGERLQLLKGTT